MNSKLVIKYIEFEGYLLEHTINEFHGLLYNIEHKQVYIKKTEDTIKAVGTAISVCNAITRIYHEQQFQYIYLIPKYASEDFLLKLENFFFHAECLQELKNKLPLYGILFFENHKKEKEIEISSSFFDQLNILLSHEENIYGKMKEWKINPGAVLIEGESGTGKRLIASLLSRQYEKKYLTVNPLAFPEGLQASLFAGHKIGSFTGAIDNNDGFFKNANGTVLYIDEFQDCPLSLQVQLLTSLQSNSDVVNFIPIGSGTTASATIKVVISVNQPIKTLIEGEHKKVRPDLIYRTSHYLKLKNTFELFQNAESCLSLTRAYLWQFSTIPPKCNNECIINLSEIIFLQLDPLYLIEVQTAKWHGNFRTYANFCSKIVQNKSSASMIDNSNLRITIKDKVVIALNSIGLNDWLDAYNRINQASVERNYHSNFTTNNISSNDSIDQISKIICILKDHNYVLSKAMLDSRMRLIVKSDKTLKNLLLKNKNEIKSLDIGTYDLIKTIERKKR